MGWPGGGKNLADTVAVGVFYNGIDSPLGLQITDIYSRLGKFWNQEAQKALVGKLVGAGCVVV